MHLCNAQIRAGQSLSAFSTLNSFLSDLPANQSFREIYDTPN
jgi:hypothetical protein